MKVFHILLTSIDDVKRFNSAACEEPYDIDLLTGRYIIDAKSIMGIFSLDLAKPLRVDVHGTEEQAAAFYKKVGEFVAEH